LRVYACFRPSRSPPCAKLSMPPFHHAVHSAGPPERMRPNSAPWTSAAFLSRCCLRCGCRPAQLMAPELNRTDCTGRGRRGAVCIPPALDLVPLHHRACASPRYFRACTERRSGPGSFHRVLLAAIDRQFVDSWLAGYGALQEQHQCNKQVGFPAAVVTSLQNPGNAATNMIFSTASDIFYTPRAVRAFTSARAPSLSPSPTLFPHETPLCRPPPPDPRVEGKAHTACGIYRSQ
jgi:hypothetical protein